MVYEHSTDEVLLRGIIGRIAINEHWREDIL